MAYQNVGTPRFYINVSEWLASSTATINPVFRTLPVSASAITTVPDISAVTLTNPYVAILGHSANAITLTTTGTATDIINGTITSTLEGFSIFSVDAIPTAISFDTGNAGSILLGTYYDMPHSPDLKLTMTREYGGIKTIETKGGASLSNTFYTSPPDWGTRKAWQLGDTDLTISGRRVWDLSFSYLSDKDVFPENPTEVNSKWGLNDNPETPDFTSEVIHKTNGGQLPFIFQPDSSNNSPDQFAICKLDQNSFRFEQVANGVYNMKLKIREVW